MKKKRAAGGFPHPAPKCVVKVVAPLTVMVSCSVLPVRSPVNGFVCVVSRAVNTFGANVNDAVVPSNDADFGVMLLLAAL